MVVLAGLVTTGSPARATGATAIDRATVARTTTSVTMTRSWLKWKMTMTDDIVIRLRMSADLVDGFPKASAKNLFPTSWLSEAANEIERLRTELNLARRAYDMEIFGESDIDENGVVRGE